MITVSTDNIDRYIEHKSSVIEKIYAEIGI